MHWAPGNEEAPMTDDQTPDRTDESEGQVSELAVAGEKPDVISPGDAVAGSPEGESGTVQEGAAGPNSIPVDETHEHSHVRAHEDDAQQTAEDADE